MVDSEPKEIDYPPNDEHYNHGVNCSWILIAPPSHVVRMTFSLFLLEGGIPRCMFDHLTVIDSNGQRIGR